MLLSRLIRPVTNQIDLNLYPLTGCHILQMIYRSLFPDHLTNVGYLLLSLTALQHYLFHSVVRRQFPSLKVFVVNLVHVMKGLRLGSANLKCPNRTKTISAWSPCRVGLTWMSTSGAFRSSHASNKQSLTTMLIHSANFKQNFQNQVCIF